MMAATTVRAQTPQSAFTCSWLDSDRAIVKVAIGGGQPDQAVLALTNELIPMDCLVDVLEGRPANKEITCRGVSKDQTLSNRDVEIVLVFETDSQTGKGLIRGEAARQEAGAGAQGAVKCGL